ncbi:MAG: hypothetical protein KKA19_09395 [Candidatus Margulisbacteria bacterium]|nr:hypothetical protein [Candidatus Margulisiibacteriota bacterium]
MLISILYFSFLKLEMLMPIIFRKRLHLGLILFSNNRSFLSKHILKTTSNSFSYTDQPSVIEKIFLLITDSWFFRWLKKSEKSPIATSNKEDPSKTILNNNLNNAHISYLNNNTRYLGEIKKKYIC